MTHEPQAVRQEPAAEDDGHDEGEDEEDLRSFLEENLSPESDIDAILSCFEDGCFYGNAYDSDRVIEADLEKKSVKEWLTVSEIR